MVRQVQRTGFIYRPSNDENTISPSLSNHLYQAVLPSQMNSKSLCAVIVKSQSLYTRSSKTQTPLPLSLSASSHLDINNYAGMVKKEASDPVKMKAVEPRFSAADSGFVYLMELITQLAICGARVNPTVATPNTVIDKAAYGAASLLTS